MSSAQELLFPSRPPVRGLSHPKTNFTEQFHLDYVRSVTTAACCLSGDLCVNDGMDLLLSHQADCAVDKAGMNFGS